MRALVELGRLCKTLYLLRYLDDKDGAEAMARRVLEDRTSGPIGVLSDWGVVLRQEFSLAPGVVWVHLLAEETSGYDVRCVVVDPGRLRCQVMFRGPEWQTRKDLVPSDEPPFDVTVKSAWRGY